MAGLAVIVLDTCALIFDALNPERLSSTAYVHGMVMLTCGE